MRQTKLYEKLNNLLMIFLCVQPILDIYMAVVGEKLDVFGISIVTLIRIAFVITLFSIVIISQIKYKYHIKYVYGILGYLLVVGVYSLLHHVNIISFDTYFITEGIYNVFTELLYVLRLVVPILLMYTVILTKPSKEKILKVIVIVACIVATTIVITNIFEISYASYSKENGTIKYNFIDWFRYEGLPHDETLSKGYFVSANQIGALLVFLLPMVIYYTVKKNNWYLYLILAVQILGMVIVGTRVANYGWILIAVAMIAMYIILYLTKRYKIDVSAFVYLMLIFSIGAIIYANSPAHSRTFASEYATMYDEELVKVEGIRYISIEEFNEIISSDENMEEYLGHPSDNLLNEAKAKYIYDMYKYHHITGTYILEIYPYDDDLNFWLEIFSKPISIKGDNRGRQVAIIKRIKENNNNILLDTMFGMGATPLNSRGYMIENDIISHYYNLGIVGIILFVFPFVLGIIYSLYRCRKHIFSMVNMEFAVYVLAIVITYFIGYFAGHVIDEYIISIYLGTISGILTNFYRGGELSERNKT